LTLFVVLVSGSACRTDITTCAGVGSLSVIVTVRDSLTRASLDGLARVTIRDLHAPFDSMVGTPSQVSLFAPDRVTTFRVRVEAPGYVPKVTDVVVPASAERCGSNVTQRPTIDLATVSAIRIDQASRASHATLPTTRITRLPQRASTSERRRTPA